ncbi:hypothetical protein C8D78_0297 [Arthrobacter oryzae]|uniref:Uncharacterized protein n=1 Tax=Arthrobacter oryzae TaxID=409290 RepID=A0A495FN60_9MICC|nr:hypothetical protein C8D78_0297 [Arthrobacter oryzae]
MATGLGVTVIADAGTLTSAVRPPGPRAEAPIPDLRAASGGLGFLHARPRLAARPGRQRPRPGPGVP